MPEYPSIHDLNSDDIRLGGEDGWIVKYGVIRSPGKFEGEFAYIVDAYNAYLDGFSQDDGKYVIVDFPAGWKGYAETWRRRTVKFYIDDQGFVCEVWRRRP